MKKLRRLLFRLFLFVLLIVLGIVFLNTLRFNSKQVEVEKIEPIEISDEIVRRFSEAIQIPTVSFEDRIDSSQFFAFRYYIDSVYSRVGKELEHYTVNDFSLVYKWPGKNTRLKPILFIAHLDVVPATAKAWEKDPFSGAVENGLIWGRGTLDDKLNVCGILEAVDLLLEKDYQPERTLYLAFGHDEEIGGINGAQAIAQRFKQQGLEFEFVLDEGMVVLENALPGLDRPVAMIGTAEKGYTTLQLTAMLEDGGHSSMPPPETAIGVLSKAIHKLEADPFPAKISGPTLQLLQHTGPEMRLPYKAIFANMWLFEGILKKQFSTSAPTNALIRTTTAPTIVDGGFKDNVMPATASAAINFRIYPGESVASVIDRVREVVDDKRIAVVEKDNVFSADPSPVSDTESFGFTVLQKTILQIFPESIVAPALMVAATDSRSYEPVVNSTYRFNPIQIQHSDLSRIHGHNERISIQNYERVVRFYHQLILNSCK